MAVLLSGDGAALYVSTRRGLCDRDSVRLGLQPRHHRVEGGNRYVACDSDHASICWQSIISCMHAHHQSPVSQVKSNACGYAEAKIVHVPA